MEKSKQCDFCGREAVAVWHRTNAEIAKSLKKSKVPLMSSFHTCETHRVPWRPWVAVGTSRPLEDKPKAKRVKSCPHCGKAI